MFDYEEVELIINTIQDTINSLSISNSALELNIKEAELIAPENTSDENKRIFILGKDTLRARKNEVRILNKILIKFYTIQERLSDSKGTMTIEDFLS
mgnify:FL=1